MLYGPATIISFLRSMIWKKPSCVHARQVAGAQPAIGGERLGGLRGAVPVALHDLRPLDQQLANLAGRQLGAGRQVHDPRLGRGQRDADKAVPVRAMQRIGVRDRAGLGEPIPLDQPRACDALEPLLHLDRQRRRPADTGPQRGQAVAARILDLVDRRVHRRDAGKDRRALAANGVQHVLSLEGRQQDHRRRHSDGEVHARGHAVGMRKGQRAEHPLAPAPQAWKPGAGLESIGDQAAVGVQDALGLAGGAAGIEQHGRLRRVELGQRRLLLLASPQACAPARASGAPAPRGHDGPHDPGAAV